MPITHAISFNNYDLTDIIEAHSDQMNTRVSMQTVPKRHGALLTDVPVLDIRKIQLKGVYYGTSQQDARDKIRAVENALGYTKGKLKLFSDRYFNAWKSAFSSSYVPNTNLQVVIMTMEFSCDDPFEYDEGNPFEQVTTLTSGDTPVDVTNGFYKKQIVINYPGTAPAYLKVLVTADVAGAVKQAIVRNLTTGKSWTYAQTATGGVIASTQSLVVDGNAFTVQNNGVNDLPSWQGIFVWLQNGNNTIEVQGNPADYAFFWDQKYT
jgi:phage-related protein